MPTAPSRSQSRLRNSWQIEKLGDDFLRFRRAVADHDDVAAPAHPLETLLLRFAQAIWLYLELDPDDPAVPVNAEVRQASFDRWPAYRVRMVVIPEPVPVKPTAELLMDLALERQVMTLRFFLGRFDPVGFAIFGRHQPGDVRRDENAMVAAHICFTRRKSFVRPNRIGAVVVAV